MKDYQELIKYLKDTLGYDLEFIRPEIGKTIEKKKEKNLIPFTWEEYKKNKDVKLVTICGNPVRIIYYGAKGEFPIIGLYEIDGYEYSIEYNEKGECNHCVHSISLDLRILVESKKKYAGVYIKDNGDIFTTAFIENVDDIKTEIPGSTYLKTIEIEL